ncbi:MAG: multidrug efflux SMR transporter [Phycisphaeraceae bacterium]|nr:multidrug efflux SMR transporter [Phycisphaeraceae bacterium]
MPWLLLTVAGLLEVVWAIAMKRSAGFTRPGATVVTIVAMIISFYLLARAMKTLPIGTAYPVWVGIGAVGAALAGPILFKDRFTPSHAACVLLIILGIAGLKVLTPSKPEQIPTRGTAAEGMPTPPGAGAGPDRP